VAAKKIKASEEIKASAPHVIDEDPGLKDLLEKTRQVGRALQSRREGTKPDYNKLAKLLCEFSTANVYLINREGKILGYSWISEYHSEEVSNFIDKGYMPEIFVEKMNQHRETILSETDGYLFDDASAEAPEKHMLYIPIYGAAERLGTLLLVRFFQPFSMRDLVLAEYLATLVGIEILHERTKNIEERSRERLIVQMAMRALSYSEVESVKHIISELGSFEGVVIAKRNRGFNSSFTVRKVSHGEGVERTFQTYSPAVNDIAVKRRGDVRRAKLYYLRDRRGNAAKIREKV